MGKKPGKNISKVKQALRNLMNDRGSVEVAQAETPVRSGFLWCDESKRFISQDVCIVYQERHPGNCRRCERRSA